MGPGQQHSARISFSISLDQVVGQTLHIWPFNYCLALLVRAIAWSTCNLVTMFNLKDLRSSSHARNTVLGGSNMRNQVGFRDSPTKARVFENQFQDSAVPWHTKVCKLIGFNLSLMSTPMLYLCNCRLTESVLKQSNAELIGQVSGLSWFDFGTSFC